MTHGPPAAEPRLGRAAVSGLVAEPAPALEAVGPDRPRTVIGAPLYNHAAYLEAAVESLLAQTDRDFALLLVDDVSTDETPDIALRYVHRDPRVSYHRNPARLGLVANWRRAFQLGRERYPGAAYFAWGSDHDLWHPRWLELMVTELERRPEAVLAYPTCQRITDDGRVAHSRGGFHTVGKTDMAARVRCSYRDMHAGDMVYGLVRTGAMERAGVFRPVLEPDRLLMAELAIQGEFVHVPQPLWQRRFVKSAVRARQRRAIFPHRRPLYSWLPPWVVRPVVFAWVYGVRGAPGALPGRRDGLRLAWAYAGATVEHVVVRRMARLRKVWSRTRKRLARARKRVVRPLRRRTGRALRTARRQLRRRRRPAARQPRHPERSLVAAEVPQPDDGPADGQGMAAARSSSSSS